MNVIKMPHLCAQLKIIGQVQGIGLRYTVFCYAQKNNLNGWVRNEPDQTVTCQLQNNKEEVQKFINWLKQEIKGIKNIITKEIELEDLFEDFIIKY